MEYRQLPHGNKNEKFSVIGLGLGGIGTTPAEEIEAIIRKAMPLPGEADGTDDRHRRLLLQITKESRGSHVPEHKTDPNAPPGLCPG